MQVRNTRRRPKTPGINYAYSTDAGTGDEDEDDDDDDGTGTDNRDVTPDGDGMEADDGNIPTELSKDANTAIQEASDAEAIPKGKYMDISKDAQETAQSLSTAVPRHN